MQMIILNNLFQKSIYKSGYYAAFRLCSTLFKQEFTVIPFCNIKVNVPFNVLITPLDVFKYKDSDKVIVKLISESEEFVPELQCTHSNKDVDISDISEGTMDNVTCKIEAPVKANFNITTRKNGSIDLSNFNGDKIFLKSENGDIITSKCHCDEISVVSSSGNILCKSVIQAARIYLKTHKYGTVTAGRLQGLDLKVETENGSINTESSYCNNSIFISEMGNLDLRNAHKNCKICIRKMGVLSMTGFDGVLHADLNGGNVNVQLSRILGKSNISISGKSLLNLKLSETCLEESCFKIIAKAVQIDDNIDKNKYIFAEHFILNPRDEVDVTINGKESEVNIQTASWIDMFNSRLSNR